MKRRRWLALVMVLPVVAAASGDASMIAAVRLLIARGDDVNAQDDIRDSAFVLAGARGHTEVVRLLIGPP